MKKTGILLVAFLTCLSCNSYKKKALDVISKSGDNQTQLEKVIEHYKETKDREKLEAAYFLISNMSDKYGRYGNIINNYYPIFNTLDSLKKKGINEDTINSVIKNEWRKSENKYGPINNSNYLPYPDIQAVTCDFLIENIDYAFKAWREKPWSQKYNFDQFCEFILPYRFYDEPLQFYRKNLFEEYAWIEDSLKNRTNPVEVCTLVSKYVAKKFNFCSKLDKCPLLGANDVNLYHSGICEHRYLLVGSILRSIGIPVCIDFATQFNNNAIGHAWLVTIDKNNKFVPFNGGEPGIEVSDTVKFPIVGVFGATKVYRQFFSEQKLTIPENTYYNLIDEFKSKYLQDVTYQYKFPQLTIDFKLPDDYDKSKIIYLCSFGYGLNFLPCSYTINSSEKAVFKNVGTNAIYFIAGIENGFQILSNPRYLSNKSVISLDPDLSKKREIKLTRKFLPAQYIFRMYEYAAWLKGARFEASDNNEFKNSTTLYKIDKIDYLSFTEKEVETLKPYRYYRFISSDTGKIRIAELGFVENKNGDMSMRPGYKVFGYSPVKNDEKAPVFLNAFDKNISTNLNAPAGSWVAIDFGKPVKIEKIQFLIRNDLNAVEIGDIYELFYFDKGWVSLEKKIADRNFLIFKNVPENALLLLRDLTKGKEERIFIYKEGKQVWL